MSRDDETLNRRSYLTYVGGTAAAVGLAGCADEETPAEEPDDTDDTDDTDDEDAQLLREFDEELPEDPSRLELLQHANGLASALSPWVYLHQQYSIYGLSDDIEWEVREDEDIIARQIETDLEEMTITQGTFPTTLDPMGHNDTPTYNVVDQAYEPVLYRDLDGDVIASIATDWERVDDNTVELEIRDGVTFHTGTELTAEDVAFSINRTNNPDVSDQAGVIGNIDEAYAEDGSVVVELNAVEPAIFRNFSSFGRVMEQEWTEERSTGELATEINGTGAYELEEFADGSRVVFERYDDYWGENDASDRVVFNVVADEGTRVDRLLSGESDLITNVNPRDISEVNEADNASIGGVPSIRTIFLVMNDAKEPFDSLEFRQAMNFAVEVNAIIENILNGFGDRTSQPTLQGHNGHNPRMEPYGHDPERAEALVEESGHAGAEITVHTTSGRYLRDTDIAESLAAQIDDLDNVSADADLRETSSLFAETLDGDQETSPGIFLLGWGNPTLDANYVLEPWFTPDSIFSHFTDEELVDLIDRSNEIAD